MTYRSRRQYTKVSSGTMHAVEIAHLVLSLNLLQEVRPCQ